MYERRGVNIPETSDELLKETLNLLFNEDWRFSDIVEEFTLSNDDWDESELCDLADEIKSKLLS